MLFKKKNKDENMKNDDEVRVEEDKNDEKEKFHFTWPFLKSKKSDEEKNDTNENNNNNNVFNDQNSQGNLDFNNDFIRRNNAAKTGPNIKGLIIDIILIIAIGYFVFWSAPKIVNWFTGGRQTYVDLAKSMAAQVQDYYTQEGQKCNTSINHRYFFNIYNSKEQFGDKYKSPIDGQPMEGYIEIEAYKSGYTVYITLTDGFFGVNHIKMQDLNKSDIKIFTFLGLDNYPDMECSKSFEFSK